MTVPAEYGGYGRSHLERFVVTEELLAAGAPVAAHWIADRQIVPSLLKYGTEVQKRTYLPAIARGECFFGIGMSEPDSGSDLASVRTKAVAVDGGWEISGTKVWTSGAHRADAFICLARTAPVDPAHRHDGLSQFIVDLRAPGVDIGTLSGTPVADTVIDRLVLRSALIRGIQVSAVLDRILELSIAHATERLQFGRPLSKFQSVQNLVADMAAETALARAAVEAALGVAVRSDWTATTLEFSVAVARSCAGHAASVVVRNAHQVHGAIGTTQEHRLREYTQAALAWRSEYGSMHHWDSTLSAAAMAAGRDGLWALMT